jgi:NTP pyrophosphatase (non-canonical NTP hydrolase)
MIFANDKDRFIKTYFGDNYMKELSMENDAKLSSLHRLIFDFKKDVENNLNRCSVYDKAELLNNIHTVFNTYFHEQDVVTSNIDKRIMSDIKAYRMPIMEVADSCYEFNIKAGWWTDINTGKPLERNRKEIISLIVSEIFEALDAERKGEPNDKHLPKHKAFVVEMADALIRVFDYSGRYHIDFFGNFLKYVAKKENKQVHEVLSNLSDYISGKEEDIISYHNYVNRLKQSDYNTNIDTLGQLHAYSKFCVGKTEVSDIDNNFEALLKIANKFSSISDLELSNHLDCETFDDAIEAERLAEGVAMIFDYVGARKYSILDAMVEKITYNKNRNDHKIENRKKVGGKIN